MLAPLPTSTNILGDEEDRDELIANLNPAPTLTASPTTVASEDAPERKAVPSPDANLHVDKNPEEDAEGKAAVEEAGVLAKEVEDKITEEEDKEEEVPEEELQIDYESMGRLLEEVDSSEEGKYDTPFWENLVKGVEYNDAVDKYYFDKTIEEGYEERKAQAAEVVEDDTRVWMALSEGGKELANNAVDFIDWGLHLGEDKWEPLFEMRDDLTEAEEWIKTGSEVGGFIGTTLAVGAGLAAALPVAAVSTVAVGIYSTLRAARIAPSIARFLTISAKWLPAELLTAQALLKPEDARLIDMVFGESEIPTRLQNEFKENPLDNKTHQRILNLAKDATDTAMATAILGPFAGALKIVGKRFTRNSAEFLKESGTGNLAKEMVGLGATRRSKVSSLEEYLSANGMTLKEIEEKVGVPASKNTPFNEIVKAVDVDIEEVIKRATDDPAVQKRILARNLMEDQLGNSPTQSLAKLRAMDGQPSKFVDGDSLIDDINNKLAGDQDEFLRRAAKSDLDQSVSNGSAKEIRPNKPSVLSNWWDWKVKPLLFDSGKPFKNLDTLTYGKIADGGVVEAVTRGGFKGYANLSGQLVDNFVTTVHTRMDSILGKFHPTTSTRYNQADGIAHTYTDVDGFAGIKTNNKLSDDDMLDMLDYYTAKSIDSASRRSTQFWKGTKEYDAWMAKGEGKSDAWWNGVEDLRKLLEVSAKSEFNHGLLDEKSLSRILRSDVGEDGKSWFFPREAEGHPVSSTNKSKVPEFVALEMKSASSIKALKGNTGSPLLDSRERLFNHFYRSVSRVEMQKIKQSTYSTLEDLRAAGGIKKDAADRIAMKVKSEDWKGMVEFKASLKEDLTKAIKTGNLEDLDVRVLDDLPNVKAIDDMTTEDMFKVLGNLKSYKVGDNMYDVVYYKGKPTVYQVFDPAMRDALNSLGPQQIEGLGKWGEKFFGFTRTLTKIKGALITKTPTFIAPAQLREMISSSVFSQTTRVPSLAYLRGVTKANEIMAAAQNGGLGLDNTRLNAVSDAFGMAARASMGTKERAYVRMMDGQVNALKKGYIKYSDLVNRIEMSPKLGELSQAIKMGMNPQDASNAANNIMNFSRRSSSPKVQLLADHMLFLKPSVIGMSKLAETAVEHKFRTGIFLGGYMAGDMAVDHLLAEYYPEVKASIPEYSTMINTVTPNLADWSQLPQLVEAIIKQDPSIAPALDKERPLLVNFGAHESATVSKLGKDIIYNTIEYLAGDKATNDSITRAVGRFMKGSFGIFGTVPDILAPIWHLGFTGKDNFGRDIVSNRMSDVGDHSTQFTANTRPSSVTFAKVLNKMGLDVYPSQLDWLGNWLLPGAGELALNGADALVGGGQKLTPPGSRSKSANPIEYFKEALAGRFFMGHKELSAARTAMHQLNGVIQGLKLNLENQSATNFFDTNIQGRAITLANGNEGLIDDIFPHLAAAKSSMDWFRKQRTMIELGHPKYAHLKDDDEKEEYLNALHKEEEGVAYEAYVRLKAYDMEAAAEFLGPVMINRYNNK